MAKTAINQLQDQIEAIRNEAYAAGYAAAMQSIREFAAKPATGAEAHPGPQQTQTTRRRAGSAPATAAPTQPARQGRPRAAAKPSSRAGRAPGPRLQRGNNARLIEEILQSNTPRALRPAEIRSILQSDKGVAMAFTSIRHALGQLEARQLVEQVADSKTWRHRDGGGA